MPTDLEALFDEFCHDPRLLESEAEFDLKIDPDSVIDDYLHTQADRYWRWARLASIAERRASQQRFLVKEQLWPMARMFARADLKSSDGRVTEAMIEDQACLNEAYVGGQTLLVDLEAVASTLKSAERAMAQRLEMLRSLNSRARVEMGGYPNADVAEEAAAAVIEARQRRKPKS